MDIESKRIIKVLIALCTLFVGLIVYLSYFETFQAARIVTNSYNKRQWLNEEYVLRGTITDRNGKALAYSEKIEDKQVRQYKYGSLYSHVIGYSSKEYGKAGLEASYNSQLLNISDNNPLLEIRDKITGPREKGNNLRLTVIHELQTSAEKQLRGKKGAIVVMEPKSGEILAMVSKPDFNPATLREDWEEIVEDKDSPLLNRAAMGLYTPGSVFKVITATAAMQQPDLPKTYRCEGSTNIEGYILRDYQETAHGEVDLEKALVESCNVAFSQIGINIGEDALREEAERYMFNREIPFALITKSSQFPNKELMNKPELGATAIGQGKLLTTPLNMALAASAIANEGKMVKPVLVKEVISPEGRTVKSSSAETLSRVCTPMVAEQLTAMMIQAVEKGTGKNARIQNIKVAGKTGTAENETGKAHAWFIGFAPADNPKVAVAVVLENVGSTGGKSAAPIAREMMNEALNKLR
ncbi:peptidoglycan D,D-transpeptidase FtsI family protein [Geosporobacter ferrireducens]|uniref:Penicillin-binding protein A n=1 Tax=Geosporobacter ferrireducens TaxID=1424294 RepID=A0A1D8GDV6_9FIRM|nr:penicillin-binding protein 2 [Geosporobacter ferrireducens]AOT69095.1 penicillin-binding protein A [Geosporobacter ferrireducens]MTI56769.1 penicillin-binding protein 2 [Geosporobacter ferrireducens]